MRGWLFLIGILPALMLGGQNLIPNPSFENLTIPDCPDSPNDVIALAPPWYTFSQTPDLYVGNCTPEYPFFEEQRPNQAADGTNYVGIWSTMSPNGILNSEGLAVHLVEPLTAGLYRFSAMVNNRGSQTNSDLSTSGCNTAPARNFSLYLSPDSIQQVFVFTPDQETLLDIYLTGEAVWSDSSQAVQTNGPVSWFEIGGCLMAQGGEQHLSLNLSVGRHIYPPSCGLNTPGSPAIIYYFDMDDLVLERMEAWARSAEALICSEEGSILSAVELVGEEFGPEVRIEWPDGSISAEFLMQESGFYPLNIVLSCGKIPLDLTIKELDCESDWYIPNVFSPNDDGINDTFGPFVHLAGQWIDYQFQVYDRWGNLVFTSSTPNEEWNGRINGQRADSGVYIWHFSGQIDSINEEQSVSETGSILLLKD